MRNQRHAAPGFGSLHAMSNERDGGAHAGTSSEGSTLLELRAHEERLNALRACERESAPGDEDDKAEETRLSTDIEAARSDLREALAAAGLAGDGTDEATEARMLASLPTHIAVGPIAGRKTLRLQVPGITATEGNSAKPITAARDGFSRFGNALNAAVACRAQERQKLQRLWRYVARPPLALERLSRDGDGLVVHELKRPFRDATTECLFEPLDLLARLAALVPRPRSHLIRYHAVLAPKCPPPPPRRAAATHAAPTRRPRFLPVSATADNARTANHHPAPTPRIPTVEILKLTGHPGFSIYYPHPLNDEVETPPERTLKPCPGRSASGCKWPLLVRAVFAQSACRLPQGRRRNRSESNSGAVRKR